MTLATKRALVAVAKQISDLRHQLLFENDEMTDETLGEKAAQHFLQGIGFLEVTERSFKLAMLETPE